MHSKNTYRVLQTVLVVVAAAAVACSSSDNDGADTAGGTSGHAGAAGQSTRPPDAAAGASGQAGAPVADAGVDAPAGDAAGPPDGGGNADTAPPDAAVAAESFASNQNGRFGQMCARDGLYGFGDGALLICANGKWRYALRTDVPDGVYGGFTSRPDWFPPLRTIMNLPAEKCRLALKAAPIAADQIHSIIPQGALIAGHVTPIDHSYLVVSTLALDDTARMAAPFIPVHAVADGRITSLGSLGSPTSMRVVINHGCETVSIYMVLNKLTGPLAQYQDEISAGGNRSVDIPVKAGDVFALQRDNPMDFSLHDGATWLSGYAHPFPYTSDDTWKPYTVDPLPYFPQDIATAYAAKMQRTAEPRYGRIDWDKAGTASGNWFRAGTMGYSGKSTDTYKNATESIPGGPTPGKNGSSWGHLSLVPHWVQPSVWMASLGVWADPAGDFRQFGIRPGPARPDQLTVDSGTTVYELVSFVATGPNGENINFIVPPIGYRVKLGEMVEGVLAVRVNADRTLTVEPRPDLKSAAAFTTFTAQAQTFWR